MMTEAKIESKLVDYCKKNHVYCRKFASPAHRGVPDRVLIKNGNVLFLELKREGGKATTLQQYEIELLQHHGVYARIVTGWDETKAAVDVFLLPAPSLI